MADSASSSPKLFHCPTCGAALPTPGDQVSVRCEYCGSTVLVPPEYRTSQEPIPDPIYRAAAIDTPPPLVIDMTGAGRSGSKSRPMAGLVGWMVMMVVVCILIASILVITGGFRSVGMINQSVQQVVSLQTPQNLPGLAVLTEVFTAMPELQIPPTPEPMYETVLQFGSQGIGPGQFDDARFIAIDPQGYIFTAEFQDGRVQKFTPNGKFAQLINVPADGQGYSTISDIATDYSGKLYIARRGSILVYNTADGSPAGAIPSRFPDTWYESLATDPANNLFALHSKAGELDLIKFDLNLQQLWRKVQITQGLYKNAETSRVDRFTVDGLGDPYLLDESRSEVYRFNNFAEFVDRFGGKGDLPGQFNSPDNILVDGQGRIYIANFDGIHIFANSTAYIQAIPRFWSGALRDFALDLQGNLYILSGEGQVHKIRLK